MTPVAPQEAPDRSAKLLALAEKRFGGGLTEADRNLFRATANGEIAIYGDGKLPPDKPEANRILQADRIRWLCTDPEAVKEVLPHEGVRLQGARIEGQLRLSNARIEFPLSLVGCSMEEGIALYRAHLFALFLDGTHSGPIGGDGLVVKHDLQLKSGFEATGEVRLLYAKIGGQFSCNGGHFTNTKADGYALYADRIDVKGSVFLNDRFEAVGQVRLLGAKIGGNLSCTAGHFTNTKPDGNALLAEGIEVTGSVFLRNGFQAEGVVNFTAAAVGGWFQLWGVDAPEKCTLLDLESARIGTLWDEEESWPQKLALDGLVYDRLYSDSPMDADTRVGEWIRRNDQEQFLPQPYEQLAKVLQEMGHEEAARQVRIAKEEDPVRLKALTRRGRLRHKVLGATIGYGYRPWRAALWMLGFWVLGSALFGWAACAKNSGLVQVKEGTCPTFNALIYSLDTFVPLIDLHQAKYRLPTWWWLRWYLWFHIICGWALTTLLVVGLSGLVHQ